MASSRIPAALVAVVISLSACSGGNDGTSPAITRALLPALDATPAPGPTTTSTTRPLLSPLEADRLAQTQLRVVLAAAVEDYAERGSYDRSLEDVAASSVGVNVVSLEEAALRDGVVYDAHDQRLTLHRRSATGRWFCIDVTDEGKDYGFGDSFETALSTCTDGVRAEGWGDIFSPTGPDEAAIKTVFGLLVNALDSGDSEAAHVTFASRSSCSLQALQAAWPAGIALITAGDFELQSLTVAGDTAIAAITLGPISDTAWRLTKDGAQWRHATDPCDLLGPVAADLLDASARDLLEQGLFAVQSAFVVQTDFAFASGDLSDLNPDLVLVPTSDVAFGTLSYAGNESRGLLITAGAPGRFYCAVESLSATTAYGEAPALDEIDTAAECRAHAGS